mgnify:CR=1 FL=1
MAVILKKVGCRSYAYHSVREGGKVVHRYLGPADDPETEKKAALLRPAMEVPEKFHRLFWDARPEDIHLKRNSAYIIERVLEFGGLDAMEWVQRIYPTQRIIQVLASGRAVSPKSRNFWCLWLGHENP